MADANADLIAQASAATAQAVAGALGNLRLRPTPTVKLNRFCGRPQRAGDLTINEWLDEFEVYSRQLGLEGNVKTVTLVDHLGGDAKEEVLCASQQVRDNFTDLTALLKRRFGPLETVASLSRALGARVRLEGETLADYSRAIMRLYSRMEKAAASTPDDQAALVRLRDMTLKGQFKKGVGNGQVLKDLERMDIRDPDQTFADMREEILRLYADQEIPKRTPVRNIQVPEQPFSTSDTTPAVQFQQVQASDKPDPTVQAFLESQRETNRRLDKLLDIMAGMRGQQQNQPLNPYSPPWVPPQPTHQQSQHRWRAPPSGTRRGACYQYGQEGHFRRECPLRPAKPPSVPGYQRPPTGGQNPNYDGNPN